MQNFGIINETFKNIFADAVRDKDLKGKRVFKAYFKALKESNVLRSQYHIYDKLEKMVEVDKLKSNNYVKESISILKKLGKDNIVSENNKLVKFLTKYGYEIIKEDYDKKELHKNINSLAIKDKTSGNIDKLLESTYFISDYINNNKVVIKEEPSEIFKTDMVLEAAQEKFNDKFASINEGEFDIVKLIIGKDVKGQEKVYTDMVKECIDLVNLQLVECNIDEKDALLQVKDKLLRYSYTEDNFISEITKIIDLKSDLI